MDLEKIKKKITDALSEVGDDDKLDTYQKLYLSELARRKINRKTYASSQNGQRGGRPQLDISQLKNPKHALWKREYRARMKNKSK